MNDPTNWDVDFPAPVATYESPELAREAAKRCNAYPGLIRALIECRNATDESETHAMIDRVMGHLGLINEDGSFKEVS